MKIRHKLWLRHPMRMFWLKQGYCPVCESSPPRPNCYVCHGSYAYGPKITPETKEKWFLRFCVWLE